LPELAALLERAQQTLETLEDEQAEELQELLDQLEDALAEGDDHNLRTSGRAVRLYYATTNTP